jgi:hypothetical protein
MGKITIKHYLNTELKPVVENSQIKHPLYVQIIYNRNVYKIKSNNGIFKQLTEIEFRNNQIQDILKDEILNIESTINLLENYDSKLITGKNISKLTTPLNEVIEQNFSKLIAKELPKTPYFFKNSSYTEIVELLDYLNAYGGFTSLSEKVNCCAGIIGNLNYPSVEFYEKKYLCIDFYTGEKFEEIKKSISFSLSLNKNDQIRALKSFQDLIML